MSTYTRRDSQMVHADERTTSLHIQSINQSINRSIGQPATTNQPKLHHLLSSRRSKDSTSCGSETPLRANWLTSNRLRPPNTQAFPKQICKTYTPYFVPCHAYTIRFWVQYLLPALADKGEGGTSARVLIEPTVESLEDTLSPTCMVRAGEVAVLAVAAKGVVGTGIGVCTVVGGGRWSDGSGAVVSRCCC